ncbi:hypothetical protein [Microcoleus sp. OTE_8_concoct_300]|uniref:hypothetical protein n=1 Tax=Microcoleus sp. OTE_8_concoct_300 TaxID=2964710 RepID=UPI00403F1564
MNSSQLSLFNTNTATGNVYRAGDWVKVKKKPAIAAWVKRDEVFKINQIHPIDGSLKFWNPHIKQWDFLYPEEVKLTVEPVVGEASELTVEPVVGEASELTVEPVVGEASELTVEPVVGEASELTVEPVVGEASNGWLESHYKIRRGGKQHSIKCPEIRCNGPYYSYRWMEGKRQRAKYCPASKCPEVRKALSLGQPVNEILKIISNQ